MTTKTLNHSVAAAGAAPHKVVIRSLPALLPEAVFWSSAEPFLVDATTSTPLYDWRTYCPGKVGKTYAISCAV